MVITLGCSAAELFSCCLAITQLGNRVPIRYGDRDNCISLLRGVMSERGVQQKSLAATLEELQRICDSLARHHQPAARELAAIVWRLYCCAFATKDDHRKVRWPRNYLITPQA
ncbi:hypothetical protein ACLB1M_13685 [Escherichia coli]